MDFVSDALFDGRPIRILAVLDAHTREALSIVPRASFRAFDVVAELTRLARERGRPKTLKVDNVLCREAAEHVRPQVTALGLTSRGVPSRGVLEMGVALTLMGWTPPDGIWVPKWGC